MSFEAPDYPLLLRRMEFLDLVQRVARMDVEACQHTVGLDTLSFHSKFLSSDTTSSGLFKMRKQQQSAARPVPGAAPSSFSRWQKRDVPQTSHQPQSSSRLPRHRMQQATVKQEHYQQKYAVTTDTETDEDPIRRPRPGGWTDGLVQSSPEKPRSRSPGNQPMPPHMRHETAVVHDTSAAEVVPPSQRQSHSDNHPQQRRDQPPPPAADGRIPVEVLRMVGSIIKEMRHQPPSAAAIENHNSEGYPATRDTAAQRSPRGLATVAVGTEPQPRETGEARDSVLRSPSRPEVKDVAVDASPSPKAATATVAVETGGGARSSSRKKSHPQPQNVDQRNRIQSQPQPQSRPPKEHAGEASAPQPQPLAGAAGMPQVRQAVQHFPPAATAARRNEGFAQLVQAIALDVTADAEAAAAEASRSDALAAAVAAANAMIQEVDQILGDSGIDGASEEQPFPPRQWNGSASRKTTAPGHVPSHVVERIMRARADTLELQRTSERLYNTSSISQYVFADRATNAILGDLVDEVLAEVADLCDDYVDGLAAHELQ